MLDAFDSSFKFAFFCRLWNAPSACGWHIPILHCRTQETGPHPEWLQIFVEGCPWMSYTHTHIYIYIEIKAFQLRTFHFLDAFLDLHLRPCCSFWKQSFSHVSASEVSAFPFISNLSNRASDGTVRSFLSALSGAEEQLFGTSKRASNGIFKPFHTGGMWTFVEPC